jgi:hypothetical protein
MDMVEKVARALCGSQPHMLALKQLNAADWEYEVDNGWRDCEIEARAAIAAMRLDPSLQSESCPSDIVDAGRNKIMAWDLDQNDFKKANAAVVDCFNAMIDAALGEGE